MNRRVSRGPRVDLRECAASLLGWSFFGLLLFSLGSPLVRAQAVKALRKAAPSTGAATVSEQRAMKAFEAARHSALDLHAFLEGMPKGADLHMHLSGAVYAETFLKNAVADKLCVNPVTLALAPNMGTTKDEPSRGVCLDPAVPAARVLTDQHLYDALVDSFSMRGFVPTPGFTAHDQFFSTFGRVSGLKAHNGEWLDEVATRAAVQNEQYLEVMLTPTYSHAARIGNEVGWPSAGGEGDVSRGQLATLRDQLLLMGLREEIAVDRKELDEAFATRDAREHCGQADAKPGCSVKIRVIYQVVRAFPPQHVFAQTLLGFELASADPRVVGINFVQPEDAYLAMSEYHRQMLMMDYLHGVYPKVHISLHAGELAPGLVPPAGLGFHIREAVELGHAERIGHGVDVMYEDRPRELLKEMAERHVMVEINLTSNDVILGVKANEHSLPEYRGAGVPVALSTDDEGVSRIDLTHEYARAAVDFGLSYLDLKKMARTGLEHSFLPGASLWALPDVFTAASAACAGRVGVGEPSDGCRKVLDGSEKAAQQWELERRFAAFEAGLSR